MIKDQLKSVYRVKKAIRVICRITLQIYTIVIVHDII